MLHYSIAVYLSSPPKSDGEDLHLDNWTICYVNMLRVPQGCMVGEDFFNIILFYCEYKDGLLPVQIQESARKKYKNKRKLKYSA